MKKKKSKRDTYRYELHQGHKTVGVGITNDPERREREHRVVGKKFSTMKVVGPKVSRTSAENWEEDKLAQYRRNHKGNNPKYNKTDR